MLCTTRLHLAPLQRSDAGDVFAYASNPNMSLHVPWETHRSASDAEAFLESILGRGPDEHTWGLRFDAAGPVMGVIELGLLAATEADVHFVLAEPYWNRGLMTEAARCVIGWAFAAYPALDRIVSNAAIGNAASPRVMEVRDACRSHALRSLGQTQSAGRAGGVRAGARRLAGGVRMRCSP